MPARPVRRRGCSAGEPAPGFRLLREGSSGSVAAAPSGAARGEPPAPLPPPAAAAQGSCSGVARCPGLAPAAAARAAAGEQAAVLPEAREGGGARGRLRRASEGGRGEGRSPLSRKLPPTPIPGASGGRAGRRAPRGGEPRPAPAPDGRRAERSRGTPLWGCPGDRDVGLPGDHQHVGGRWRTLVGPAEAEAPAPRLRAAAPPQGYRRPPGGTLCAPARPAEALLA